MKCKTRKRWQFLWCDLDSPPRNGDAHHWKSKVFRVATFEKAMDLMLDFIRRQIDAEPAVDYECCALHERYSQKRHQKCFPRVDRTEHPLAEYAD